VNVLIAEDDPTSRRLLESHLRKWGHEVTTAADGTQAWQLFEAAPYPLVISDWAMPGLDGVELIRRIRSCQGPRYVYAILLTAKSQKEDIVRGMEAGADSFLSKPVDREELRVHVQAGERIIRLERSLAEQNRALRAAQSALVQSEKLASLGQLAAGVAHEINTPITYVTNNLSALRRDVLALLELLVKYREGREALERVTPNLARETARIEAEIDFGYIQDNLGRLFDKSRGGLQRVRDIVKNLSDFARLDEAESKEIDLNQALESTLEILHYELERKQIRLEKRFQELPPLLCHPGQINQVFLNLILNAAQACEPGGLIRVRTGTGPGEAVVAEVEDNGSGIRPEHLPHLFEPFFTTKPPGQGTGLGLSVSYGIIRDHGGSIDVTSRPDVGSTFRVRLPLTPIQEKQSPSTYNRLP
jgi:signal transduction histidine kinase